MPINPAIFKAYDVRGVYPTEIDEQTVYLTAKAYSKYFNIKTAVVSGDVRKSTPALKNALVKGLLENGVAIVDIGIVSTDMMHFAVAHFKTDGGITISASHNPGEYNGMKIVLKNAKPVASESGLFELRDLVLKNESLQTGRIEGSIEMKEIIEPYIWHVKSFVTFENLKPLKIFANPNFGMAGVVAKKIFENSPIEIVFINETPDGNFPKGRPDPMHEENRTETAELTKREKADVGVAWDADADRCFFFDEQGLFIPPYFISAVLARIMLEKNKSSHKEKILLDTRLTWAIQEEVEKAGGVPSINKAGYTFLKETMRKENILFGAETSAHYFFKDNFYSDNGMIPLLLMLEELSVSEKKMSELVKHLRERYFTPGELNFKVTSVKKTIESVKKFYLDKGGEMSLLDGVSFEFDLWRFNLRGSNTEPVIRLNIESTNKKILDEKIREVTNLLESPPLLF